ncbi:DUF4145 domain-containing protein [Gimesia aquarii]|uniref:DUF4145 domain-containing protein n=1 Tax=Gimesia aquarii TaxID=2527964 RepID=A0A517WWL1_9PLAN|nr:DUF4145 domain-containing protein [Gimesia aquarii]QDU09660.1 hypothetical protein V202x_30360 [Gimesia aquarii]
MDAEERIIKRLGEMIDMGEELSAEERRADHHGNYESINEGNVAQWKMSSLNILLRGFGENSIHYKEFVKEVDNSTFSVEIGNNILFAALDDMRGGYLAGMKELLEAEIFSDFMEQAEELFTKGYHPAAAVVAGCVLEDALRKLCEQQSEIELPDKPKLSWMNDRLREHSVYNLLTHKRITANADLRNKAAHGEWSEFDKDDVKEMVSSINTFMQKHFG